jgi:hypothetical protein
MAMRLTAVVVEALDVRAQSNFWAQALHGEEAGIGLLFVPSARPKRGKNRLHLDLAAGPDQDEEVRRLLDAGASRVADELADPEGNEFRVLMPS